jgi:kynurenine formamidase
MKLVRLLTLIALAAVAAGAYALGVASSGPAATATAAKAKAKPDLWRAYDQLFKGARYIDLSHTLYPQGPVWKGFGPATFGQTTNPETGQPYTYAKDGFEATQYQLSTDQYGTQLDPPAHWAPEYPGIDEIPSTYAVRKLVVINTAPQVRKDPDYFATVADVRRWEKQHGRIPAGSVVMFRSDWGNQWTSDPEKAKALAADPEFPSVALDTLKFLHQRRNILFHGHEPLDTDSTPTLEGEDWLMHHGYTQAEGVANLDRVPATGCLITTGFPKFAGGVGGYARYTAVCPAGTDAGVAPSAKDAPLPKSDSPLAFDAAKGYRVR